MSVIGLACPARVRAMTIGPMNCGNVTVQQPVPFVPRQHEQAIVLVPTGRRRRDVCIPRCRHVESDEDRCHAYRSGGLGRGTSRRDLRQSQRIQIMIQPLLLHQGRMSSFLDEPTFVED